MGHRSAIGRLVDERGHVHDEFYASDALKNPHNVPQAAVSKAFHPKTIAYDPISKTLPEAREY